MSTDSDGVTVSSDFDLVSLDVPGPRIRPVPGFSLDIPAGWAVSEYPGALFLLGPSGDTTEWSNVIVRHDRVLASATLDELVRESWESFIDENPDATLKDERLIQYRYLHYVREVEFPPIAGEGLTTRIDSFVFAPETDNITLDVFRFTWMHPTEFNRRFKPLYVRMLSSLRFSNDEVLVVD